MQIADLRIRNFREIRDGRIRFGPHTVLVGSNNCGKTTVIEALALLFGRDRMVRNLTEHDFFGSSPQPADRILLVATVIDFDGDDPADHTEWFKDGRGVAKWWNSTAGTVSATRDDPGWKLACQIGFCARFDRSSLEVETARYFHDDDGIVDVFAEETWAAVPARLVRDIGFFLVPASRTWDRTVSFGSELFRRVVSAADGQPAESVIAERDRLRTPQQPLESDPRLEPIVASFDEELAGFFPAQPKLRLQLTTTDSDGLLEAVVPHYAHPAAALGLPARRHGSGLLALQHLLLLLQFGKQRAKQEEGFWMALEEPELHVPPPLQQRLVHRIQALSTQTFVTTHSPTVAAISDPQSLSILRCADVELSAASLLTAPLPAATPNSIRKLFQLNRPDTIAAVMHDAVLIPEGRIDFDWLRLLARAVDLHQGWVAAEESHFSSSVGVIPTHDAAIEVTVAAIHHLHPCISALVDGDQAGIGYAQALVDSPTPPSFILRWPDQWTIEDLIGWILSADTPSVAATLFGSIAPPIVSIPALVLRLKDDNRQTDGLKQDQVTYEIVANAIGSIDLCRDRARLLLDAVADGCLGRNNPNFAPPQGGHPQILIFQP